MDIPQPPQGKVKKIADESIDEELRNIIDKLAVFVARNGPDFESMTKQKQQGNPRFTFLYGGEFYNYYMYRVTTEQSILKHKAQIQQQRAAGGQGPGQGFGGQGQGGPNPFLVGDGGGPPFQQPPQQRFPFDNQMMAQQPPPRLMSRFDRGPPGPRGQFQNFERPPLRMPSFHGQQQQQQQRFGGPGPFDQGGGGGSGFDFDNFEGGQQSHQQQHPPPARDFDARQMNQGQQRQGQGQGGGGFDFDSSSGPRGQPGSGGGFEPSGPGPGPRNPRNSGGLFDAHPPPNNSNSGGGGGGGGGFDGPPPNNRGFNENRIPGRNRFDIGPPLGFDASQGFNQNFQSQQNMPPQLNLNPSLSGGPPPPTLTLPLQSLASITAEMESLKTQKQGLEEQIKQSEQNLAAQNQVLMTQQQSQIEDAIKILQEAEIKQMAADLNIDLSELDAALMPIVETCTKDSISGGKAWIFTHTSTPRHYQLLSMYLLRFTTDPDAEFHKRLHIIYLVNDVLHHCMRKGAEDLRQVLEAMVIPMFSHAKVKEMGNEEHLAKLDKLLALWESKCQYVSPIALEKLKDSSNTWLEYHSELLKRHAVVVTQIAQNIQKTCEGYQAQHQIFCQHNVQKIKTFEQKLLQLSTQQQQHQQHQMNLASQPPLSMLSQPPPGAASMTIPPPSVVIPTSVGGGPGGQGLLGPAPGALLGNNHLHEAGVVSASVVAPILDISRPPPGCFSDTELLPALPYYELPAGLMVPLVKPDDDNYKAIDPKDIRLPPPCPPSEKLILAVEAFYAAPSHERPRDSEGWERLGLYEYYKSKNLARKQKEDDIRDGRREKSKSPSPLRRDSSPSGRSPPRRRYHSKSPTPTRRRRSRSKSPPSSRRSNNKERRGRRSRSRSRSRSPIRRSPTPPSFGMAGLGMDRKLDESNKGHQLLKKMGWGGQGLGANEQGIEAPISGGEVREKRDLYRGVGISMNDPFECYRKSKGQAFVDRMRARADDRP